MHDSFAQVLRTSRLREWHPAEQMPSGFFILVGVMIGWSLYDQDLVIALDEAIPDGRTMTDTIAIVCADRFSSFNELDAIFPGIPRVAQSPYIRTWTDGQPWFVDFGQSAMAFLTDRYGLVTT